MPLSVLITAFKKENVKKPLEGFGVLIPSKEQQNGLKTLGNAWPWYSAFKINLYLFYWCLHRMILLLFRYTFFICDVS